MSGMHPPSSTVLPQLMRFGIIPPNLRGELGTVRVNGKKRNNL